MRKKAKARKVRNIKSVSKCFQVYLIKGVPSAYAGPEGRNKTTRVSVTGMQTGA